MIESLDDDLCTACEICFEICPTDVFRLDPVSGNARIAYRDDCQTCFSCQLDCPEGAISVGPFRARRRQVW